MSNVRALAAILGCLTVATPAIADTVTVTSPSGVYTNNGSTASAGPFAYNTWFANNVKNGGSVGITTSHADSGNGSIEFSGPANAKADFEYYFAPGGGFALSNLSAFSYDVYRSSSSTAASKYEPALRLYVSDYAGHSGYLVYEGIYNGQSVSPVDQFTNADVMPAYVWSTGTLPDSFNVYNRTIADWVALLPNLQVLGFSAGIGSGWDGTFDGSVDNITYGTTINGQTTSTTFNFETAAGSPVPEPFSLSLVAIGLAAGAVKRRRLS